MYDRAERVTEVREAFQAQRVQKEFVYATGSGFSDKRAGKLISVTRHNSLSSPCTRYFYVIEQELTEGDRDPKVE